MALFRIFVQCFNYNKVKNSEMTYGIISIISPVWVGIRFFPDTPNY